MFKIEKWKSTWKSSEKFAHTYFQDFAVWDILISHLIASDSYQKEEKDATKLSNFF